MIRNNYVDDEGHLTEKYSDDKSEGALKFPVEIKDYTNDIVEIVNKIADIPKIENARDDNVDVKLDKNKLAMSEFKALWSKINARTIYRVVILTVRNLSSALLRH